ncbi:general secretion pathway protein C [Yersinia kristensenii]|uniref:General secretion pathway protein C n=1 Tax=Yersinia kristensenii TaxID=28152 RepID=A0A0T9LEW9_YERKR|nr:general secretion pathway protein C [Yersinia kristensenii]
MLSFFNLIVITPYKILVNKKKIILEIIIILCFFYQVSVGFNMVMGGVKEQFHYYMKVNGITEKILT